jgi:hypothetical protein
MSSRKSKKFLMKKSNIKQSVTVRLPFGVQEVNSIKKILTIGLYWFKLPTDINIEGRVAIETGLRSVGVVFY